VDAGPVIHRARWIVPVSSPPIEDGEIVVECGRIAEVRPATRQAAVEHGDAAILPGFVNAHCHLEYTDLAGMTTERSFVPWLRQVTNLKRTAEPETFFEGARRGALMNARAGIGAVGDFSDAPVSVQALNEAGLRGVVFQEVIALRDQPTWRESLDACRHKADQQRQAAGLHVDVRLAPHAPYSVVEEALRTFSKGPTAIHCAESWEEVEFLTEGRGELADWFREMALPVRPVHATPVEYLGRVGLLRPEVQLVHCVQLSGDDIETIARACCSVVHCPRSNSQLGVGTAPVHELLEAGVNVALGTDSLLSNDDFDMFEEMRAAQSANLARGMPFIPARTLLAMATRNAAHSLGLGDRCGVLAPGASADFQVLSLDSPNADSTLGIEDALISVGSANAVGALYVRGQLVHQA